MGNLSRGFREQSSEYQSLLEAERSRLQALSPGEYLMVKYLITLQPRLLICKMESYHLLFVAILDAKENLCEGPSITVLVTIAISEGVYFP